MTMAAWVPNAVTPRDPVIDVSFGDINGAALAVDPDPNTTMPDASRVFYGPSRGRHNRVDSTSTYILTDAACQLQLWYYVREVGKWFMHASAGPAAMTSVSITAPPIPRLPMFIRVQANAGGAKFVGMYFAR